MDIPNLGALADAINRLAAAVERATAANRNTDETSQRAERTPQSLQEVFYRAAQPSAVAQWNGGGTVKEWRPYETPYDPKG